MSSLHRAIRNAADLRHALRELRRREEQVIRPTIAARRAQLVPPTTTDAGATEARADVDMLEAHIRVCFVDQLLAALNWDLPGAEGLRPTLWTEVPVLAKSQAATGERVLFLDYFGVERTSDSPLIIVETKRPNTTLPVVGRMRRTSTKARLGVEPTGERAEQTAAIIAQALRAEASAMHSGPSKEWREWFEKMREYVTAITKKGARAPIRAVFTNGEWLIVFTAPSRSFASDGTAEDVVVFLDRDDLEARAAELFGLLAYEHVAEERRPLLPEEVALFVDPSTVNGYMHGLRLMHAEEPTIFAKATPRLAVSPIVLLRSTRGRWVEVLTRKEQVVPLDRDKLDDHVRAVNEDAQLLLAAVFRALPTEVAVVSLRDHFATDEQLRSLPGVSELRERDTGTTAKDYRVLTGTATHFIRLEPGVVDCSYHAWSACDRDGRAHGPSPEAVPTFRPRRNYFVDGRPHHCAHDAVGAIKSAPLGPLNRSRCGTRSGNDGDPFCEIFAFDQTICCRTCAFEQVCACAPAFVLPCSESAAGRRLPIV